MQRVAKCKSITDKHLACRTIGAGAKDRLSFNISHFAAQILRVDIQTKVLDFQEFTKIPGREKIGAGSLHRVLMRVLLACSFQQIDRILQILQADPKIDKNAKTKNNKTHATQIQGT